MSTEMRPEQGIAGKFVRSALDENGVLSKIEFTNSENFNFAYDVMDALAERKPDQTALIYVSKDRTIEKKFTFQDINFIIYKLLYFSLSFIIADLSGFVQVFHNRACFFHMHLIK